MVQYEYEIMQKSFQSAYIRQRTAQNTFAIDESKKGRIRSDLAHLTSK